MNIQTLKDYIVRSEHFLQGKLEDGWSWYVATVAHGASAQQQEIAIVLTSLFFVMLTSLVLAGLMLWRKSNNTLDRLLLFREIGFFSVLLLTFIFFYFQWTNLYVRTGIYVFLAITSFFIIASLLNEHTMTNEEIEDERRKSWEKKRKHSRITEYDRRQIWDDKRTDYFINESERRLDWEKKHNDN